MTIRMHNLARLSGLIAGPVAEDQATSLSCWLADVQPFDMLWCMYTALHPLLAATLDSIK